MGKRVNKLKIFSANQEILQRMSSKGKEDDFMRKIGVK